MAIRLWQFLFIALKTGFQEIASQAGGSAGGQGRSVGFPNFHRRHIAKPVSATGQKKTRSIEKALILVELLIRIIADHTSKWPKA